MSSAVEILFVCALTLRSTRAGEMWGTMRGSLLQSIG